MDMARLPVPGQPQDVIWAKGSAYIMGAEPGLGDWRRSKSELNTGARSCGCRRMNSASIFCGEWQVSGCENWAHASPDRLTQPNSQVHRSGEKSPAELPQGQKRPVQEELELPPDYPHILMDSSLTQVD
jgi:hypothetical protein